jgi:hypothetical protein
MARQFALAIYHHLRCTLVHRWCDCHAWALTPCQLRELAAEHADLLIHLLVLGHVDQQLLPAGNNSVMIL